MAYFLSVLSQNIQNIAFLSIFLQIDIYKVWLIFLQIDWNLLVVGNSSLFLAL